MKQILFEAINEKDLKNMIREVFDEKLNQIQEPKKTTNNTKYLNRFEVADLLRISLPTLNNWSKSGIVQSYRIGNRILYKTEEIDQAVQVVKNLKYKRG